MIDSGHQNPHWYVLGPGAIGCLWAGYWAEQNNRVSLIGKQAHTATLQLSMGETTQTFSIETKSVKQLSTPIEHLLITTKAQHTKEALNNVQQWLSDDAVVVVLQNGMAAAEINLRPQQKLFAATTTDGAYRVNPRHVVHAGKGLTHIGPLSASAQQLGLGIIELLPKALRIDFSDDIKRQLWQKLAINCAINGLTVLHQCRNGELLKIPEARQSISELCREIIAVTQALQLGEWFLQLEDEVNNVLTLTANNINSMLQDTRQGRSTEIEQINGYLCRQAKRLGIALPHNQALVKAVQQVEATAGVLP